MPCTLANFHGKNTLNSTSTRFYYVLYLESIFQTTKLLCPELYIPSPSYGIAGGWVRDQWGKGVSVRQAEDPAGRFVVF